MITRYCKERITITEMETLILQKYNPKTHQCVCELLTCHGFLNKIILRRFASVVGETPTPKTPTFARRLGEVRGARQTSSSRISSWPKVVAATVIRGWSTPAPASHLTPVILMRRMHWSRITT